MVLKAKIIQGNVCVLGARKYKYTECNLIIATGGHKHMLCNLGVKFEIQNCGVDLLVHKNSAFLEVKNLETTITCVHFRGEVIFVGIVLLKDLFAH